LSTRSAAEDTERERLRTGAGAWRSEMAMENEAKMEIYHDLSRKNLDFSRFQQGKWRLKQET